VNFDELIRRGEISDILCGQNKTGFEREEFSSQPSLKPRRMEEVDEKKCRPHLSRKRYS
jgi:hypothetical protein